MVPTRRLADDTWHMQTRLINLEEAMHFGSLSQACHISSYLPDRRHKRSCSLGRWRQFRRSVQAVAVRHHKLVLLTVQFLLCRCPLDLGPHFPHLHLPFTPYQVPFTLLLVTWLVLEENPYQFIQNPSSDITHPAHDLTHTHVRLVNLNAVSKCT